MHEPAAATPSGAPADAHVRAIGFVVVATVTFAALDATAKYLVTKGGLPVEQVVWVRFVVQFVGMICLIPLFSRTSVKAMFVTSAPGLQMGRSVFMALMSVFNFMAVEYLRLDQTMAIMFLAPLVVALLAGPILGEWIGWRRMVSILIGFVGVVLVVRPGVGEFNIGVVYSLLAMFAIAGFILLTRKLAGRDPAVVTLNYSLIVGVIVVAPFALKYGVWPTDIFTWLLLTSMGVLGGVGHYLFILAYKHVETSFLSPFLYTQIVGMVALGYFVFEDVPDVWSITGSIVIVSCGLYLYHRERVTCSRDT